MDFRQHKGSRTEKILKFPRGILEASKWWYIFLKVKISELSKVEDEPSQIAQTAKCGQDRYTLIHIGVLYKFTFHLFSFGICYKQWFIKLTQNKTLVISETKVQEDRECNQDEKQG